MKKVQLTLLSLLVTGTAFSQAITDTGTNVGIDNVSPSHKLDVNGDINMSSGSRLLINSRPVVSTQGTANTFIGDFAGNAITTGINNAFIGYKSGEDNTTGHSNAFIGFKAGENNTTGFSNAFIGQQAGRANLDGKTNVMIGRRAGFTSATGDDNVFIGHLTGQTNNGGSSNTYIGSGADGSAVLTNATAIGANASVTQDSSLILGDNAKVGIGTTAPAFDLDVVGDINFDGTLYNAGVPFSTGKLTCTPLHVGPAGPIAVAPNTVVMVDETAGPVFLDFPPGVPGDEIVVKSIAIPFSGFPGSGITISSPIPVEDPATPGAAYPPGFAATFVGGIMKEAYKWHYCDEVNGTPVWVLILDYEPHIEEDPIPGPTGPTGPQGADGPQGPMGPTGVTSWTVSGNDQYSSVSGNVGVGTSTPGTKLHVHEADFAFSSYTTGSTGTTPYADGLIVGTQLTGESFITNYVNENLRLGTNGQDRVVIKGNGKVGINNQTSGNMLNVQGLQADTSAVMVINALDTTAFAGATGLRVVSMNQDSVGVGIESVGGHTGVIGKAIGQTEFITVFDTYGGDFSARSASISTGVRGRAYSVSNPAYGVVGTGSGSGTINYGIYGSASGGTFANWAGYFANGNVNIDNKLSVGAEFGLTDKVTISDFTSNKVSLNVRGYDSGDTSSLKLFEEDDYGFEFEYDGSNDRLDLWSRKFAGNEANRMTWTKDGKVGIGISNPGTQFEVNASTTYGQRMVQNLSTSSAVFGNLNYSKNHGSGACISFVVNAENNSGSSETQGGQFTTSGTSTGTKYAIWGNPGGAGTLWAGWFAGDVYTTGSYQPSDRSLKTNIEDLDNASELVSKLKVHTYNYLTDKYPTMNLQEGERFGFLAEELKEVLPQLVKSTEQPNMLPDGEESTELPTIDVVNYTELIPILTAAIQEQQKQIETLQPARVEALELENEDLRNEVIELRSELDDIKEMLSRFDTDLQQCCFSSEGSGVTLSGVEGSDSDSPILEQNAPNPFRENSVIKYYLPSSTRSAELVITELSGTQLKSFNLQGKGFGQVLISGGSFKSGTYIYTLMINGERVASKQMILL